MVVQGCAGLAGVRQGAAHQGVGRVDRHLGQALQARCPGVPVMQFHPAADWLAQSGVVQAEQFAIHQPYADLRSLWQDLRQMGGAQLGAALPRPTVSVAQWRQWWRDPEPIALDYQVLLLRLQREQAASDLWSRLAARG